MCCGYNFLTRMYDEWVFSTSLCCCAYVVQRQTWIWPISVRYAWFLATPSWFSLVYKLWSLNNKLPLYQKMKEPKLTHIRTEHMIKNKLEKIIKARLQKNTQLVVTGEWKTCLYCIWNHQCTTKCACSLYTKSDRPWKWSIHSSTYQSVLTSEGGDSAKLCALA